MTIDSVYRRLTVQEHRTVAEQLRAALEDEKTLSKSRIRDLEASNAELTSKLMSALANNQVVASEATQYDLEKQVAELRSEKAAIASDAEVQRRKLIESAQSQRQHFEEKIEQLNTELSLQREASASKDVVLVQLKNDVAARDATIQQLMSSATQSDHPRESSSQEVDATEELQARVTSLEAKIARLNAEMQVKDDHISRIASESDELRQALTQSQGEQQSLTESAASAADTISQLKNQLEAATQLQQDARAQQTEISSAKQSLEHRIAEIEAELSASQAATAKLAQQNGNIAEEMAKELETLQSKLTSAYQQINTLEQAVEDATKRAHEVGNFSEDVTLSYVISGPRGTRCAATQRPGHDICVAIGA